MSYQALARKYRPREFSALVGQEHVVRALTHALERKRLHHAYLLTGTRGVGKTTIARIMAKALNCVGADGAGDITSTPCNRCAACVAIDAGRFVDYIEMDAASNRGVEEMTQLLERAAYAPSNARFKVYTIDEVHMLSTHAFNAMLKTLEEPPDYVKFILATTDPQKIPVTVLSRCLQFNLKQVAAPVIGEYLAHVLQAEGLAAEAPALRALAHAARGSMRDALSLLDQAIAHGGGQPSVESVRQMLGAIDTTVLVQLVDAIADGEAARVLDTADRMAERGFSFAQALRDLAGLLHRIAIAQQVDAAVEEDEDAAQVRRLAQRMSPEHVQLLYQIALHGRNDLPLAPDEYAGFTMSLLRMLAFRPEAEAEPAARSAALHASRPPRTSAPAPARAERARPAAADAPATPSAAPAAASAAAPAVPPGAGLDWPALALRLKLTGFARELALRSELLGVEGDLFRLRIPVRTLLDAGAETRLRAALAEALGRPVRIDAVVGATVGPTAAGLTEQARARLQRQAEEAIYADPFVRELIDHFGATVDPATIRPSRNEA